MTYSRGTDAGRQHWAVPTIAMATVAVSFSAIFIRIAGDDAGTVVWVRMAIASMLLLPLALGEARRGALRIGGVRIGAVVGSGVLLAGHFILWTASLQLTSIAASVLLVSIHPVIVTPLGARLIGDRVAPMTYLGMTLALLGTVLTCVTDVSLGAKALIGDGLALAGAICLAGYLLTGRRLRRAVGVAGYSASVFAVVSAVAFAFTAAVGALHMPSARTVLLCLALAAVCTLAGHTAYNWALRYVTAATVSVAFLGEPPLAIVLALLILGTAPSLLTVMGGIVILAGVTVTLAAARGTLTAERAIALE